MLFVLLLLFLFFLSHCKWVLLFLMCFYHLVELGVGSVLRCDVMWSTKYGARVVNTRRWMFKNPCHYVSMTHGQSLNNPARCPIVCICFDRKPRWILGPHLIWDTHSHTLSLTWRLVVWSLAANEWSTILRCLKYDDFQKQAQKNRPLVGLSRHLTVDGF